MPTPFSGRTVLITGGTRNIGLATARMFLEQEAKVCITGRSDQAQLDGALAELGANATGLLADHTTEDGVKASFDKAQTLGAPVSILVNNASVRPHHPIVDVPVEEWDLVIATNLTGAFLCSREMLRRLPEDKTGAIVNIGGLSAHNGVPDRAHVMATKAGLIGLTRGVAAEYADRVRCNCVVPGVIDTATRANQIRPDFGQETLRKGRPEEVAAMILVMSDPSQQYVTAQTVHVNGGRYMST